MALEDVEDAGVGEVEEVIEVIEVIVTGPGYTVLGYEIEPTSTGRGVGNVIAAYTTLSTSHSTATGLSSTRGSDMGHGAESGSPSGYQGGSRVETTTRYTSTRPYPSSSSSPSSSTGTIGTAGTVAVGYQQGGYVGYTSSSAIPIEESNSNGTSSVNPVTQQTQPAQGGSVNSRTVILSGVLVSIGVLVSFTVLFFCYKKRKLKRQKGNQEMVSVRDHTDHGHTLPVTRPDLSLPELYDIIPLPPPPPIRYSQISTRPLAREGSGRTQLGRTEVHGSIYSSTSSWTDDSEMDAFATDGSTIARTLSTLSTSSTGTDHTVVGRTLERGIAGSHVNPFDHPAYTLSTRRRNVEMSSGPNRRLGHPPAIDPFADDQSPEPPSSNGHPPSPFEEILISTPRVDDGTTFIHHIDAGRHPTQRSTGLPSPERVGSGEVHIPPMYRELYPPPR